METSEIQIAETLYPDASVLRRFLAYWESKCAGRPFPSRRDIDPVDFPYALGNIALLDIERDRFRFRLSGANIAKNFEHDLTGRYLDQMQTPAQRDALAALYTKVKELRAPLRYFRRFYAMGRSAEQEGMCLPFSNSEENALDIICDIIAPSGQSITISPPRQAAGLTSGLAFN
ncbi:MAG TPA: PAS domain-containing protein [Dongiaceae bacterium]|jgi:hypothetical protein|nr:PAS domain-containing protein [Dongiaceae bacterium]